MKCGTGRRWQIEARLWRSLSLQRDIIRGTSRRSVPARRRSHRSRNCWMAVPTRAAVDPSVQAIAIFPFSVRAERIGGTCAREWSICYQRR